MALTHLQLQALLKKRKPGKYTDGHGLILRITPAGGMYWQWRIRTDSGAESSISYGPFPEVSLARARELHLEARAKKRAGVDLVLEKRKAKLSRLAASAHTFEALARQWFAKKEAGWSPAYAAKVIRRLEADVFPRLGNLPAEEISTQMILHTVEKIVERGSHETARRVLDSCNQICRYGKLIGVLASNPADDLRQALEARPPVKHRAAIIDPVALAPILRAIEGYKGTAVVRAALRLTPLLLLRPGELRRARWEEVDLDAGLMTVPPHRMKRSVQGKASGAPHQVPLSRQAVEILRDLRPLTLRSGLLFPAQAQGRKPDPGKAPMPRPGERPGERVISDNTINSALRRLGIDTSVEQCAHGFRATARTMIEEILEIHPKLAEAQLAHKVKDPLGEAYNRAKFLEARRQMMQRWADYLDELRSPRTPVLRIVPRSLVADFECEPQGVSTLQAA
jgi:integrase